MALVLWRLDSMEETLRKLPTSERIDAVEDDIREMKESQKETERNRRVLQNGILLALFAPALTIIIQVLRATGNL